IVVSLIETILLGAAAADEPKKDQALAEALAAKAKTIELRVGDATIELVRIPAGEFELGAPPDEEGREDDEAPSRQIKITKPLYLGKYEITQAKYRGITGETRGKEKGDTIPVHGMIYRTALAYCEKLSDRVGVKVTLPTEAQWEYACRAGTQTRFYSGDLEED